MKISVRFPGNLLKWRPAPLGRKVVYTCLFGYSELWNDFHYERPADVDFVCFTDDPAIRSAFWDVRLVPPSSLDSHRHSKSFKHLPHRHFPEYDASLYIDNVVKLLAPVDRIFAVLERERAPMAMFRHPSRNCIYDEADVIVRERIDHADRVRAQMEAYRNAGHPERAGLHASTMLLRRHNETQLVKLSEEWHQELRQYSKRDQLAFDVLRLRHRLKVTALPGSVDQNELMRWPEIRDGLRLPRNFDGARYLDLHPDVAAEKLDPRYHYLHYGITERRVYE